MARTKKTPGVVSVLTALVNQMTQQVASVTTGKVADDVVANLIEQIPDLTHFRFSLNAETDRGCALMAVAYLDDRLRILLKDACFIDDDAISEGLLETSKPLSTFSSRIDLCYLLGTIRKDVRHDLHLMRKMRNQFGHTAEVLSFDSPGIADQCRELSLTFWPREEAPRRRFVNAAFGILAAINSEITTRTRPRALPEIQYDETVKTKIRDEALITRAAVINSAIAHEASLASEKEEACCAPKQTPERKAKLSTPKKKPSSSSGNRNR